MNALVLWFAALLIFRPVPMSEVLQFLATDKTDQHVYGQLNEYGQGYYCSDFSDDLVHNAQLQGIEAHRVDILFTHTVGHAIVVFNTIDRGKVYVEPQTDQIYYQVAVGNALCTKDYNLCVGDEPIRKLLERN